MPRSLAPPAPRTSVTVARRSLAGAAAAGAVLAVGFLVLDLSGAPALGWVLLAAVVVIALADTVRVAVAPRSRGMPERLTERRADDGG